MSYMGIHLQYQLQESIKLDHDHIDDKDPDMYEFAIVIHIEHQQQLSQYQPRGMVHLQEIGIFGEGQGNVIAVSRI